MTHTAFPYLRWAAIVTIFLYSAGYSSIGFGLLFIGAVWGLLRRRIFPWQPSPLDLPLAVFAAILLISAAASTYRALAFGITFMFLISGAVYLGSFTRLLHNDPVSRVALLRAWALGAVPAAVMGLVVGAVTHRRASIPQGVGPTGLGTTLLLGSILALGLSFRAQGRERLLWLGCGVISLVGLFATGSRASLVAWIVGAAYLTWRELRLQPRRMAVAAATGLAVLVLAGALAPQLAARMPDTIYDVLSYRLPAWITSLRIIRARPLLGTGFGTFATAYEKWKSPHRFSEPFAYNLALNIVVETGLAGLLAALWVAVAGVHEWLRWGTRAPPAIAAVRPVVAALWIVLLVDQLVDNTLNSVSTSAGLWLLLAFLVVPPALIRQPDMM